MFRRYLGAALCVSVCAIAGVACDTTSDTGGPTTPTPTEVTEPPFEGTLTINGGVTTNFTVGSGTIQITLEALDPNPDSFLAVGLALGIWNGTSCQATLTNDNVGIGGGVAGFANAAATLCARIYDVGKLVGPVEFSVSIKHY